LKFEISVSEYLAAQMRRASINIDLKGGYRHVGKSIRIGLICDRARFAPEQRALRAKCARASQKDSIAIVKRDPQLEHHGTFIGTGARRLRHPIDDTQSGQRTNRSEAESGRPADPVHGQQSRLQAGRAEHADQRAARAIESQPPV
jgi:hypothetical protein